MKKLSLLLLGIIALVSMAACKIEKVPQQPTQTLKLNLSNFTGVVNCSNCELQFTQAPEFKVTVKAPKDWIDSHNILVKNGMLTIEPKPGAGKSYNRSGYTILSHDTDAELAEVHVSAPSLKEVHVQGNGTFTALTDIKGKSMEVSLMGNGDVEFKNVKLSKDFSGTLTGNGDVSAAGLTADKVTFMLTGNGDGDFTLNHVPYSRMQITGNGSISTTYNQCDEGYVTVSGNGDATLKGQLNKLSKNLTGNGDIDVDDLTVNGK